MVSFVGAGQCKVIGEPDWTKQAKFATFTARKENEDELDRLIGDWTKDYPPEQVMAAMQVSEGTGGSDADLWRRHSQ